MVHWFCIAWFFGEEGRSQPQNYFLSGKLLEASSVPSKAQVGSENKHASKPIKVLGNASVMTYLRRKKNHMEFLFLPLLPGWWGIHQGLSSMAKAPSSVWPQGPSQYGPGAMPTGPSWHHKWPHSQDHAARASTGSTHVAGLSQHSPLWTVLAWPF